jgi:hypothetical protein
MSRTTRWLVAVVVVVVVAAAFGVSLWVCGVLLLPLLLKSGTDRWVVDAGLGVAVAALAALGCASWAGGQSEHSSSGTGERSISVAATLAGSPRPVMASTAAPLSGRREAPHLWLLLTREGGEIRM